ncbi:hypothetical protein PHLCEN_2v10985 [Hermanssonia centrifuga]|nr:hypothetical protein PHLCEN_2v10985 [Hermanssonia centrifuga]
MLVMYLVWFLFHRRALHKVTTPTTASSSASGPPLATHAPRRVRWLDLVDTETVDLHRDEHEDEVEDLIEDQERERRLKGRTRWFWKLYYIVA